MTGWSVPGSILLIGEYRITENGGMGIAVAVGGRASIQCDDRKSPLCVECREFPGHCHNWYPNDKLDENEQSVIAHAYRLVQEYGKQGTTSLKDLDDTIPIAGHAILDTSAFNYRDGSKRGLGSSAAVAVLATKFLGQSLDLILPEVALKAHRAVQGDLGSGYDVYASYYGGAGKFTGGPIPVWEPFSWSDSLSGILLRGPKPVGTANAISRYAQWATEFPQDANEWRLRTDKAVLNFHRLLAANNPTDILFKSYHAAGQMGITLGRKIGVPSFPQVPSGLGSDIASGHRQGAGIKCVGAGNELALLLYRKGALLKTEIEVIDVLIRTGDAYVLKVDPDGLKACG